MSSKISNFIKKNIKKLDEQILQSNMKSMLKWCVKIHFIEINTPLNLCVT